MRKKGRFMTNREKSDLLRDTISFLYGKEGRSISYIGRLLHIDRKSIRDKLKEWDVKAAEPRRHLTPSSQKFADRNRDFIRSRLNHDISISDIARELHVSRDFLRRTIIPNDPALDAARKSYVERLHMRAQDRVEETKELSRLDYNIKPIPGEEWKIIMGHEEYEVSNMGRIRAYADRDKSYYLLKQHPNKNNGRLYVKLKDKNLQVSRLVAHAFVDGFSESANTVNHNDGDVRNNAASNLSWTSQGDNNAHAYRVLDRTKNNKRRYEFNEIQYMGKYRFKTVAALSRFLGKSETQIRRYIDNPSEHNIKLIK